MSETLLLSHVLGDIYSIVHTTPTCPCLQRVFMLSGPSFTQFLYFRYMCPPGLAYDQQSRGCRWADQVSPWRWWHWWSLHSWPGSWVQQCHCHWWGGWRVPVSQKVTAWNIHQARPSWRLQVNLCCDVCIMLKYGQSCMASDELVEIISNCGSQFYPKSNCSSHLAWSFNRNAQTKEYL